MFKRKAALETFKNHLHYRKWVYLAIVVFGFFACDLAYTMTEYRPPSERKVDFQLVQAGYMDTQALEPIAAKALAEVQIVDPTLEAVSLYSISYSGDSAKDIYGAQKYVVMVAAREGAVWVLPHALFEQLYLQGGLLPLDDYVAQGLFPVGQADLSRYTRPESMGKTDEAGVPLAPSGPERLYALPATLMPGLARFGYAVEDACVVMMGYCANPETSARVLGSVMRQLP
ncbi:MAG: hypothetical protein RR739_02665 [Clostridia bacterium]